MPKALHPVEDGKKTLTTSAQERIREAILSEALPPGSRLDQNQVAADLRMSIVPVRDALKRLEAEGLVEIVPRRGAFVTETSLDDLRELYQARALTEGKAAYEAAEKLSDEQIAQMEFLMPLMADALKRHDWATFLKYNRAFHFMIYEAVNNRYTVSRIVALWESAERYRYRTHFFQDNAAAIQAEHQAILDACRAHQKDQLREAVIYHMRQTLTGVRNLILMHATKDEKLLTQRR